VGLARAKADRASLPPRRGSLVFNGLVHKNCSHRLGDGNRSRFKEFRRMDPLNRPLHCDSTTPLWLRGWGKRVRTRRDRCRFHSAGKAETCLRSPKFCHSQLVEARDVACVVEMEILRRLLPAKTNRAGDPSPALIGDALTAASPLKAAPATFVKIGRKSVPRFQRQVMLFPPPTNTVASADNRPNHTPHEPGQKVKCRKRL
jgi:hypothetical protein